MTALFAVDFSRLHHIVFERGYEAVSGRKYGPKLLHVHVQIHCNANKKR